MPTIRITVLPTAAGGLANSTNPNVVAGNRFEFMPGPTLIRVYAASAGAAGLVEGEVTTTISFTNVVQLDSGSIPVVGTTLTGAPNRNEHMLIAEAAAGGDRLIISCTNLDAAIAATTVFLIDLVPIG